MGLAGVGGRPDLAGSGAGAAFGRSGGAAESGGRRRGAVAGAEADQGGSVRTQARRRGGRAGSKGPATGLAGLAVEGAAGATWRHLSGRGRRRTRCPARRTCPARREGIFRVSGEKNRGFRRGCYL